MFKKKPKTLITFLLDRTGSMSAKKDTTIASFNAYLDELQSGDANIEFTCLQFDALSLDKLCVRKPVKKVDRLNSDNFIPRDMTPLIDASVKTIKAVERSLKKHPADKVVVCILTDGEENASQDHTWEELSKLITQKREEGWQFNFMGAGIDAYKQGAKMGMRAGETVSYSPTLHGTRSAFVATASNTRKFSDGVRGSTMYTEDQKDASGDWHRHGHAAKAVDDFDL